MIELRQRNVPFSEESNKEFLKSKLKHEMHGMQRLPALFYERKRTAEDLMLKNYDDKGHIDNLYEEIPYHIMKMKSP